MKVLRILIALLVNTVVATGGLGIAPAAHAAGPAYKITVREDGLYRLGYAALQKAGVPVETIHLATFHLKNRGVEVALYEAGDGDSSFEDGESLLFYGEKTDTKYTNFNVYWLTWDGVHGLRMPEITGSNPGAQPLTSFRTTKHMEADMLYQSDRPSGSNNDRWYWNAVAADATSNPASLDFTSTLQNLATDAIPATVRGLLKGHSDYAKHRVRILLNGNQVNEGDFAGGVDYPFEVSVPASYLVEGANTIQVQDSLVAPQAADVVYVNWFEIDYDRTFVAENDQLAFDGDVAGIRQYAIGGFSSDDIEAFDITNPDAPAHVANGTVESTGVAYQISFRDTIDEEHHYLALASSQWLAPDSIELDAPSDLRATSNGADWIAISYTDFLPVAQSLASYRTSHNSYRTAVVDVQDVYDEFNGGVLDPSAIHDFLAYAYGSWTRPAPQFVLLLGDGTYDPKDNLGYGNQTYIPPYLEDVDPWLGETAADNRYVTLVGDDLLPDMHLGRLPVSSAAEAQGIVDKIILYETNPPADAWNGRGAFVADNPDSAGNFHVLSDNIADNYLPLAYTKQKIYYGTGTYTSVAATQAAIVSAINQGTLLVSYIGHANPNWWAGEKLFSNGSIASLTNTDGRLPFFVPMTCYDGYFIRPSPPGTEVKALEESLVRVAGKGAIASWAPTGFGVASGHDILERGLYLALFDSQITQLGPATTEAKRYLAANTNLHPDLLDTFVLLGDPATRLNVLKPTAVTASDFIAAPGTRAIVLTWNTALETNMIGFNIYRAPAAGGNPQRLNPELIPAKAAGQMEGAAYRFDDAQCQAGVEYRYWLEVVELGGASERLGPVEATWLNTVLLPLVLR